MAGLEDPPFAGDDSLEDLGVVDLPHDQNDLASGLDPEAAPPPASASTNSPDSIDDFLSSLTAGRSGFWGDTEGLDRAEPRECTFMFLTPYISHNSTGPQTAALLSPPPAFLPLNQRDSCGPLAVLFSDVPQRRFFVVEQPHQQRGGGHVLGQKGRGFLS